MSAALVIEPRRGIPASWKRQALHRTDGACARLECEERAGLEFDHVIPLALGGKHAAENIEPLCAQHHRAKTNRDLKMIAKAKAQAGETGQYAKRQKRGGGSIKSRPITGWKRMDGSPVSAKERK